MKYVAEYLFNCINQVLGFFGACNDSSIRLGSHSIKKKGYMGNMAMKKYTQAEFDAIPKDMNGKKNCPSGDYTQIKDFEKEEIYNECR